MKCPKCGHAFPGRPKLLDDIKVRELKKSGLNNRQIADKFGVTRGAIQYSIKRGKKL
jgi:IS30 family transposase